MEPFLFFIFDNFYCAARIEMLNCLQLYFVQKIMIMMQLVMVPNSTLFFQKCDGVFSSPTKPSSSQAMHCIVSDFLFLRFGNTVCHANERWHNTSLQSENANLFFHFCRFYAVQFHHLFSFTDVSTISISIRECVYLR